MTEQQVRLKLTAWALERVGAVQGDAKHMEILNVYNSYEPLPRGAKMATTSPWCAAFASAAAIATGMTDIVPVECSCSQMVKLFKEMGRWEERDDHVPSIGDYIFYDWHDSGEGDCTGAPDHVGIVTAVTGGSFLVIEGNMRSGKKSVVGHRTMKIDGRYIRGYGLPDYASKATAPTCRVELPVLKLGCTGDAVRTVQMLLNEHGAKLDVDGSWGPLTDRAFGDWQDVRGLVRDLSCGPKSWRMLIAKI